MAKIYFNSRDELVAVDFSRIAVIQADGNYTRLIYMNKREVTLSMGITKVCEVLQRRFDGAKQFLRIGRSCVINNVFMERIDVLRQLVVLADDEGHEIRVKVSKPVLKSYKAALMNGVHEGDE